MVNYFQYTTIIFNYARVLISATLSLSCANKRLLHSLDLANPNETVYPTPSLKRTVESIKATTHQTSTHYTRDFSAFSPYLSLAAAPPE
jgi:hypothetical protein